MMAMYPFNSTIPPRCSYLAILLSEEEIKAKRRDAELHADEDKKKRALVEARNEAESRCYSLEKLIKEQGDKLSASDKAPLEAAMKKVTLLK